MDGRMEGREVERDVGLLEGKNGKKGWKGRIEIHFLPFHPFLYVMEV